ncbi:MAG: TAXI family TRAP transporter solute-binding subunit [Alphaproteobacteria bacterium]|nr:MAG: TAXI family TRAP transporter solute-binding subunit [Alphaproteobacteria bacterium]
MRGGLLAALAAMVMAGAAGAQELRIGTASLGGAFYPMGQAIANLVNKYAGAGISMVPVVTGGSVQNPKLLASGEVEVAITNNNLAVLALAGKGPYGDGAIDLRAVGALHPSVLHMMTLKGSGIETFEDLKGKRVAVGPAGGGTMGFLNFLLPLHGMSMDDISPSFLSYSDGFSQLADGNVDAALALSGYPAGAVMQAAAGAELAYIRFSEGMLEKAVESNPAYGIYELPAEVYGTANPGRLIGVDNVLVVMASMDAGLVERITAAIYDHLDELAAENAYGRQIDPARSMKLPIPLHDGAARYFARQR